MADSGANQATGGQDPYSIAQIDGPAGAREGAEKSKRKLSDNISESTKSRAREMSGKTKGYLQDKIPQERRDQTIWRLKRVVLEIQGHADCEWMILSIARWGQMLTKWAIPIYRSAGDRDHPQPGREVWQYLTTCLQAGRWHGPGRPW